jgi:hypothetical protein
MALLRWLVRSGKLLALTLTPLEIWQFKIRLLRKKIRGGIGM